MSDLSEAGAGGDPIAIVPYDPRWPALFDTEAFRLSRALGKTAVRIEHVGSTAVPGLAAKPVIDIQISVPALEPATRYANPLEALGYGNWRDVNDPDHRFCRDDPRRHHIHLVIAGSATESDRPLFRDFLAGHAEVRRSYAEFKTGAAHALGQGRDRYTAAKDEFIGPVMSASRDWARATGWSLGA
jgi:GrpB-like predicted nucleotidyltransferase (UPF0157 family)